MRLLLDTHILLWALADDPKLPTAAHGLIENMDNDIFYSVAALWEVAIKHSTHPDKMGVDAKDLAAFCEAAGFSCVDIATRHVVAVGSLQRMPGEPDHKDPFDRMMVAQAKADGFAFVTHDALIPGYKEPCILPV